MKEQPCPEFVQDDDDIVRCRDCGHLEVEHYYRRSNAAKKKDTLFLDELAETPENVIGSKSDIIRAYAKRHGFKVVELPVLVPEADAPWKGMPVATEEQLDAAGKAVVAETTIDVGVKPHTDLTGFMVPNQISCYVMEVRNHLLFNYRHRRDTSNAWVLVYLFKILEAWRDGLPHTKIAAWIDMEEAAKQEEQNK